MEHLNGNNTVQIKTEVDTKDVIINSEHVHDDFEDDDDDEFSESRKSASGQTVQDFLKSRFSSFLLSLTVSEKLW